MSGEKGDDGTPIPSPLSSSALLTLPKEVIREIVTYLDQRDLMNVCSVSTDLWMGSGFDHVRLNDSPVANLI